MKKRPLCSKKYTRRRFLSQSCQSALTLGLAGPLVSLMPACTVTPGKLQDTQSDDPAQQQPTQLGPKVVSLVDPKVFGKSGHEQKRVTALIQRTLCRLVDVKDPQEALRALFSPKDTVAIKLNCLAGPGLSSSVSVVYGLTGELNKIGISNQNIIIFERSTRELTRVGFEENRYLDSKPKCFGNDELGFESTLSFSGEVGSLWSRVLARTTALINIPVIKDHDLSGVGCGMKNLYGLIHNPNRYHDNNCDPYVADVSAHPYVKNKLRLILADGLTAQYHGGPARVLTHQWRHAGLLAATDPVALDAVAGQMIDKQRFGHGMASLAESKRPPKWLQTAAQKNLGVADLKKIQLIKA